MPEPLTDSTILYYQESIKNTKPLTAEVFKGLGRELRERHGLTDREAIDILNGRNDMQILAEHESSSQVLITIKSMVDHLNNPDARQEQHEYANSIISEVKEILKGGNLL